MSIFIGGTSILQSWEGERFYSCPQKTSRYELASRNRNMQNVKYSRYRKKPDAPVWEIGLSCFFWFSEICSVWGHCVSLISLDFLGNVSIEILLVIHVVSLLIERQPILMIKYKINSFNLSLHNIESCHFISFWLYEGCHTWSCLGIDSLRLWLRVLHTIWSIFTFGIQVTSFFD
jgi:hypothetical protein